MDQFIVSIERLSHQFVELVEGADPTLRVPSCPEWTVRDLVAHLGDVQSSWSRHVAAKGPRADRVDVTSGLDDRSLAQWFARCSVSLTDSLRAVPENSPCWTWWGEPATAGAVARHQVQEAAVHLWDLERAVGVSRDLDSDVADDGVSEFLDVHGSELTPADNESITLRSLDHGTEWLLGSSPSPGAEVLATSSDLVLALHRRIDLTSVRVTGSLAVAQQLFDFFDTE